MKLVEEVETDNLQMSEGKKKQIFQDVNQKAFDLIKNGLDGRKYIEMYMKKPL